MTGFDNQDEDEKFLQPKVKDIPSSSSRLLQPPSRPRPNLQVFKHLDPASLQMEHKESLGSQKSQALHQDVRSLDQRISCMEQERMTDPPSVPTEETQDQAAVKSWNDILKLIRENFPETFDSSPDTATRREDSQDPFKDTKVKAEHLPLHPQVDRYLSECSTELSNPAPSGKKDRAALKRGEFAKPVKSLPKTFLQIKGKDNALFACRVNANLQEISADTLRPAAAESISPSQLEENEKQARETLVTHSALLWLADVQGKLIEVLRDPEHTEAASVCLKAIQPHVKYLQSIQTDQLTTSLTNTVLIRRDVYLQTVGASLPSEFKKKLRCSSLSSDSLFELDDKLVKEINSARREGISEKSQQSFINMQRNRSSSSSATSHNKPSTSFQGSYTSRGRSSSRGNSFRGSRGGQQTYQSRSSSSESSSSSGLQKFRPYKPASRGRGGSRGSKK